MAATGKTPILLYGSTTTTNVPVAGNLTNSSDGCEIAINVADKNLFFKDSTNAVNTVPIRQSSGSSDGWLSSANWTTFNSKQTAYTNLTSIGSLANATGWLYNNGSGTFSYSTPQFIPTVTTVTSASISPTATAGTEVILCDTTSNNITINLPTAVSNDAVYVIKKIATANSMIIDPNGTQTIDGSTTATITVENTCLALVSDGANWRII